MLLNASHRIRLFPTAALASVLIGCALVNDNFRVVEEGKLYRSGQMSSDRLATVIEEYDIQTVVSLRGAAPDEVWHQAEKEVCRNAGVQHLDFGWSKERLPDPETLSTYVNLLQDDRAPVLVHCQGGTHRSSVASAVYVLLQGGSTDDAREQLIVFFNDAPIGELLDLYEGSSLSFDEWVNDVYPALYAERYPVEEEPAELVSSAE